MIVIRRSKDRGRTDWGWLDSRHTFSFGDYQDRAHKGFRALRVINDDRIAAGKGFGTHPHRDMEIISYVLKGSLQHKDSMGNGSTIQAGEIQKMSAGSGITHSEYNPSSETSTHFLQIWIFPDEKGIEPEYDQQKVDLDSNPNQWILFASGFKDDGLIHIHQDAKIWGGRFDTASTPTFDFVDGRAGWLHVIAGEVLLSGQTLTEGDGVQIEDESKIAIKINQPAELLLFDLK